MSNSIPEGKLDGPGTSGCGCRRKVLLKRRDPAGFQGPDAATMFNAITTTEPVLQIAQGHERQEDRLDVEGSSVPDELPDDHEHGMAMKVLTGVR